MRFNPLLTMLGATLLVGCAAMTVPHVQGDDASVTLMAAPQDGTMRTQAVVTPYGPSDINHLVIQAYKVVNGSEVAVTKTDGSPLKKDIPNASLPQPVVFTNLHFDTTYRFKAYAYADAATESLISTADASSSVDVVVAKDDRPTLATLPVKLIDRVFSGQASSSVTIKNGSVIHSGDEDFGYATP